MNKATAKRRLSIYAGNISRHNEDLGLYVSSFLYNSIMDVFLVGRKKVRVSVFEYIAYLLYKWDDNVHRNINPNSLKKQWLATAKNPELTSKIIGKVRIRWENRDNADALDELLFKRIMRSQKHLLLTVRHTEVFLKLGSSHDEDDGGRINRNESMDHCYIITGRSVALYDHV